MLQSFFPWIPSTTCGLAGTGDPKAQGSLKLPDEVWSVVFSSEEWIQFEGKIHIEESTEKVFETRKDLWNTQQK